MRDLDQPRELFHGSAGRPQILSHQSRRSGVQRTVAFGRHGPARRHELLDLPPEWRVQSEALHRRRLLALGNFDTTSALFNAAADNHVLDPFAIPSLRGLRTLGPYGHDGRTASLRDFIRNVIVNEFAGPEPAPAILDAMAAYLQDIEFLPNPRLTSEGRLGPSASAAERRGEALFVKPFPHDPTLSCASCHVPSAAFIDHRQHDVGSGGLYKTPTLVNADFNAPYFHDGRFDSYAQVVAYFDRTFELGSRRRTEPISKPISTRSATARSRSSK